MPRRFLPHDRWQAIGAFIVIVAIAVAVAIWNDYRIDQAEQRITANRASVQDLKRTNERQNAVRSELIKVFCSEIEGIKERIRATVRVPARDVYAERLRNLNADLTDTQVDALYQQAKEQEREVHERFAARDCATLPGG